MVDFSRGPKGDSTNEIQEKGRDIRLGNEDLCRLKDEKEEKRGEEKKKRGVEGGGVEKGIRNRRRWLVGWANRFPSIPFPKFLR